MKKALLALFLSVAVLLTGACIYAQQSFQLAFPVRCIINQNCRIINYVDADSSSNWHDYKGQRQTYNGHDGTDIAIKNIGQIKLGVEVLAAASGKVIAVRDGMPDKNVLSQDKKQLMDVGCGNRVAIRHSNGWMTDYCHMRNGSIKVRNGDFVQSGQKIGEIGMSGLTEFPHLHLLVAQNNKIFDPFTGLERYSKGYKTPLWNAKVLKQLVYKPLVVYNVGVSDEVPNLLNVRNEKYKNNRISSNSNMMIFWVDAFHTEANDCFDFSVTSPKGKLFFKQKLILDTSNAKNLMYVGRKKPNSGFEKGIYRVRISFKRPNTNINDNKSFKLVVY